ncbi:MAG: hypothetical protein M0P73_10595 [Syntrophobacterales bacterium]|nr:hypothetical protein [Syntrophobacterales bacterium]
MSKKDLRPRKSIATFPDWPLVWIFILATLTGVVPGPAGSCLAATTDPVISGGTATYTGNPPAPIDPAGEGYPNIYNIVVNSLTSNVGSSSTDKSIILTNTGADGSGANSQALSLTYTGGTYSLLGQNYGAYVNTTGGTGKSDGGTGGAGGTVNSSGVVTGVTIGTSGAIQVSGIGIGGFSYGGAGGVGKKESSGHVTGGTGGAGGAGGIVQITNNGPITTTGTSNSYGIYGQSVGGGGGTGGEASANEWCTGGTGGQGGAAGSVNITTNGVITTGDSYGIYGQSLGGEGGTGGEADAHGTQGWGGTGGAGGAGGSVTVTNNAAINTGVYLGAYGINAMSNGGSGGQGGEGQNGPQSNGGDGGNGGKAGAVTVNCNATIDTAGLALAVNAASTGGSGGSGGSNNGKEGTSDNGIGGIGGGSSLVSVKVAPGITLTGGISAASIAGAGGTGSEGSDDGGGGGNGGVSGGMQVNCQGDIDLSTNICNINGIWAQSISGAGGTGGKATGSGESYGGDGGNGGAGASATVTCSGSITISGGYVHGILAQSWGGAGGAGGNAGHNPGSAGGSGAGGAVEVDVSGSIATSGTYSYGIMAQSLGGAGGSSGEGTKVITYAANATNGADGGEVTINTGSFAGGANSSITTQGVGSTAICAQSVGGGGGTGDSASGVIFSVGGAAGSGGNGYTTINNVNTQVTVNNGSQIITQGFGAHGIQAQSVGGGGGNGGGTVTAGVGLSFAIGGSGGDGGDGGQVNVITTGSSISTAGAFAHGILAESIGGGGGNGGYAISAGAGLQMSTGGSGGSGGDGGEVDVGMTPTGVITYCTTPISTTGFDAKGILAQSIGGGGGAGGYSIATGLLSAPIAFGGAGETGGAGGKVYVYNAGAITTSKDLSQGIFAESVGGGGGNGGYSFAGNVTPLLSTSFSFGGSAAQGGAGGAVTVYNTGTLQTGSTSTQNGVTETLGVDAHGILAQSIGGGGGHGGWAGSGAASFSLPDVPVSVSLALSMGGTGGTGGDGGNVTVYNLAPTEGSSFISTLGDHAYGILAQSLGGGGGAGGGSVAASLSFSGPGSFSMNCPIAIGGSGGPGGAAGTVEVTNENAIQTSRYDSLGIMAQSISGGGGDGGVSATFALSGAPANSVNLNPKITIGGDGGDGSAGNTVTVTNTGAITTTGGAAIGIEAQSVGGIGGNGNWGFAGSMLLGKSSGFNPTVTVGGTGGKGGDGNTVTVTNGQEGYADLGAISTGGPMAHGILAQSLGGGGGNGGAAATLSLGKVALLDNSSINLSPTVTVGGSGNAAGHGGEVDVYNYANITTNGFTGSCGIFAQSVGGGGGTGGASHTINASTAATTGDLTSFKMPSSNITASVAVGGKGGDGSYGGEVNVTNTGQIVTQGFESYGILAQSIGGSGGVGGAAYDFSIILGLSQAGNKNNNASGLNINESVSVGGDGGTGSYGGAVTVNNSGAIYTLGSSAYGILAQSIGGSGGVGGSSTTGLAVPSSDYNSWASWLIPSISQLTFEVGGNGGSSSNGGQVTVNNGGAITTLGNGAFGIYAQSIGGGGGVAHYDQSQMFTDSNSNGGQVSPAILPGTIEIGGTGGAGGDGGTVQVTNGGVITTYGNQASGIYAQSIGGGGGNGSIIGGPWNGIKFLQYFGFAIDMGRTGGSGGTGGWVNVTNFASDIVTRGDNANGILAQSIGGAGGSGSQSTQIMQGFLWNGSFLTGASGSGGQVNVSQTGNITTYGTDAHGIVAQSIAAKDAGGLVQVVLNDPFVLSNPKYNASPGNIITTGLGSCGIVAQSLGASGNGNIEITINQPSANTGLVQGGYSGTVTYSDGTTGTYKAYGVLVMDGNQNTLTNYGSISTLDGATGTAIMQQASYGAPYRGNLTVNNYGTIIGSVNQGDQAASAMNQGLSLPSGQSTITVNNYSGATFNPGATLNLNGGTLTNQGTFSLGAGQSTLNGNFTQTAAGTFQATVNGDGSGGQLKVSGITTLAGKLQLLAGTGVFKNGTCTSILTGTTVGSFDSIILPSSLLVNFTVKYGSIDIISNVKSFTTVSTNQLEGRLAAHLDELLTGYSDQFGYVLEAIQWLSSEAQFRNAFRSLSPEVYGAATDTTLENSRYYNRTIQQRLEGLRSGRNTEAASAQPWSRQPLLLAFNGYNSDLGKLVGQEPSAAAVRRLGIWLSGLGQWGGRSETDGFSGYNYNLTGTTLGIDYACTDNLILGANFGYGYSRLNLDNGFASGTINNLYGSLYGTYFTERAYVEGIFSYGNHQYHNSRLINIGSLQSLAQSDHNGGSFSMVTEGGYKFKLRDWQLQPFAAIRYANLSEGSIQESGGTPNIRVKGRQINSLISEAGLRVERTIQTSKGTLVPLVKVGWQHDYGVEKNTLPINFDNLPVGLTINTPRGAQDSAVVRAGFNFTSKGGISTSIQYAAELSDKQQNQGVMGQIRIPF